MKTMNQETATHNYLKFCYHCEDAHLCTTEEACQACWAEQGLLDAQEDGVNETQRFLQTYYA